MKKRNLLALTAALALSSSAAFAASSAQDAAVEAASAGSVAREASSVQSHAQNAARAQEKTTKTQVSVQHYVEAPEEFEIASLRRAETTPNYRLFKGDTFNVLVIGFPDGIGVNNITIGTDGYVQLP